MDPPPVPSSDTGRWQDRPAHHRASPPTRASRRSETARPASRWFHWLSVRVLCLLLRLRGVILPRGEIFNNPSRSEICTSGQRPPTPRHHHHHQHPQVPCVGAVWTGTEPAAACTTSGFTAFGSPASLSSSDSKARGPTLSPSSYFTFQQMSHVW